MKDKEAFICPYCKEETGFRSELPMRGTQNTWFDEFGEEVDGDMSDTLILKEYDSIKRILLVIMLRQQLCIY